MRDERTRTETLALVADLGLNGRPGEAVRGLALACRKPEWWARRRIKGLVVWSAELEAFYAATRTSWTAARLRLALDGAPVSREGVLIRSDGTRVPIIVVDDGAALVAYEVLGGALSIGTSSECWNENAKPHTAQSQE